MRLNALALGFIAITAATAITGCGDDDDGYYLPTPTAVPATSTPLVPTATSSATAVPATPTATATPTHDPNSIHLAGLHGPVDVVIDDLGFPHVYGGTAEDVIYVQGYLTASSRFFQMDAFRRFAEGRLSEILGLVALDTDISMRTVFTARSGRRIQEELWDHVQETDPEVAGVIAAYARGVNAWLDDLRAGRNGAVIPTEYTDGIILNETAMSLADWRPQDTLAIARLQAWSLSESLGDEIGFARIAQSLPDGMFRDIYRSAPADPAISVPRSGSARARSSRGDATANVPQASVDTLSALSEALTTVRAQNPFGKSREVGSNNWLVAPSMSTNGHAMLANDPHLQLFNPPIWHVLQLDAGDGYRVNGVIFPGLPGVILGHNDYGAFGATTAVFDVTDVYLEQVTTPVDYPASPRTVLFKGQQVPVLRIDEPFVVRGRASPIVRVIEVVPHHGPMAPDPNTRDNVVGIAATNMSFRWTGHEISNDSRFLLDLTRARNLQEFRTSLANFAVGGQNWIWADIHGDIGFFAKVFIPQRPAGVVPYLPVDGSGTAEWLADESGHPIWVADDKIPQATNPAEGYVATSNNDQVGNTLDNDPLNDDVYLTYSAAEGFRQARILEMLSNSTGLEREPGTKMSAEDLSRYQYDHKSKEAERLVPHLLAAAERHPEALSPAMQEALDRLESWGEAKLGSPAYDTRAGVDAADARTDVPPRAIPVSDEERLDAIATSIFVGWETRLSRKVFVDDFAGTGISAPGGDDAVKALLHIIEDLDSTDPGFVVHTKGANGESTLWDDKTTTAVETSDDVMLAALNDGLEFITSKFRTDDQSQWQWGKIHHTNFQHFFGQAGIGAYDLLPFAASGARSTVNPAGYSLNSDDFTYASGPSERFVAVLDPAGIRAVNVLPGGINGNPGRIEGSPASTAYGTINPATHYGDHIPAWLNGETFEYRIRRSDVDAHAERRLSFRSE